eukprot:scaffold2420_cov32-Attheya_sp.AAC.2
MAACGVNDVDLFDGATASARMALDMFNDSFQSRPGFQILQFAYHSARSDTIVARHSNEDKSVHSMDEG